MKLKTALGVLPAILLSTCLAHASSQRVEVAFVLDSTGSMGGLIDGAKRKIWSIAGTIVDTNPQADIAMSIVTYRDRGDDYIVQSTPLSEDIQGLYGKLTRIEAGGGGDDPESVNEALDKTISGLRWSQGENVKRIVFLVGDAPPHMDYEQERQYPEILKTAKQKGIVVNAVQAGEQDDTLQVWKQIAQKGNGRYIAIPQDGGEVVIIETPFDDDILHLQHELDSSVVPYGKREMKAEVTTKLREKAEAAPSVALDNSAYYSKRASKREVITGGGDLLGAVVNDGLQIDKVAEGELPDELKKLAPAARKVWVDEKVTARNLLQQKMSGLIAKRDAFVAVAKNKTPRKKGDSFDSAVEETLRVQLN